MKAFPFNSEVITKSNNITKMYITARKKVSLPENWLKEEDENLWCIRQQIIGEVYLR